MAMRQIGSCVVLLGPTIIDYHSDDFLSRRKILLETRLVVYVGLRVTMGQ
jgi:hypothetical protein